MPGSPGASPPARGSPVVHCFSRGGPQRGLGPPEASFSPRFPSAPGRRTRPRGCSSRARDGCRTRYIKEEGGAISSKVFVGNLSFDTTSDELQALFGEVGEVSQVVVPADKHSGGPRGFAFVEFATSEIATQAIEKFDGYELGGRKLRVNEASSERSEGGRPGFGSPFGASGQDRPKFRPKPKGSRRNLRGRKRSIW
jgi:cold-inducible RNA-binding protein